ncbi:MAG: 4-alpha-glucanotransferase, partial [Candidatus Hydrogenedentes bacterium]|nr:4-alpha-glucanotransferase [Candidatus Hydrogenedentota bacterium]
RGVKIIGDVPIYVAHDSADVWAHRELFKLDEAGKPTVVAGVPPDYFSATGQLWGNPIYHWDRMSATKYQWWIERVSVNLELFDAMRLDHFRGFEAFWQVASAEATAENGEWIRGPEDEIFDALKQKLGDELPFIAEDLGVITPAVVALRERAGLVGMAVLQFGLGNNPGDSACPPHRYTRDLVAYTGTHDNETISGWARRLQEQEPWRWEYVHNYLAVNGQPFHWASIRSLMASVADVVVFPLQDVLGIDNAARMNRPGEVGANWEWRFQADLLHQDVRAKLRELTHLYGRLP